MRTGMAGLLRKQGRGRHIGTGDGREVAAASDGFAARIYAELAEELPDENLAEDLGEDLADFLERYEPATGIGADAEVDEEFLETVREAHHRIAQGY
ncbi:hypothetical protein [Streptomyces tubercidicus]|uniref:hypothetical protein n=1 Tax=Streptomyces tubercidicus TaxID=47759 RepID=UPI0036CC07DD